MSTNVFFVPGFMGVSLALYDDNGSGQPTGRAIVDLWGTERSALTLPKLEMLKFPYAGPAGKVIAPKGLASSTFGGYTNFAQWMRGLNLAGHTFTTFLYDWRKSVLEAGTALANLIIQTGAAGVESKILAHSMGSLVAWVAWAKLVDAGKTAYCSRIVTFGGALYGTNSALLCWLGLEDSMGPLIALRQAMRFGPLSALGSAISGPSDALVNDMLAIQKTWPGAYDLWPDDNRLDDPDDSARILWYLDVTWQPMDVQPDATLLAAELTGMQDYIRQDKYIPPYSVAAHIVGMHQPTPFRTVERNERSAMVAQDLIQSLRTKRPQMPSFSSTLVGDGRCTFSQQTWPGRYYQPVTALHGSMQDHQAVRALIPTLLTMTLAAPTPTPASSQPPLTQKDTEPILAVPPPPPASLALPLPPNYQNYSQTTTTPPHRPARPRVGIDP